MLNEDVFSCILSRIHDSISVYAVLRAIPKANPLFSVALQRLWELPIYLDTHDAVATSSEILDYLLTPNAKGEDLAKCIQHLVIAAEAALKYTGNNAVVAFHSRLSGLFKRTQNLKSIDYYSTLGPGLPLSRENVKLLAMCQRLHIFRVDSYTGRPKATAGDPYADGDIWDIEPFLFNLAPSITTLELRDVCLKMLNDLVYHRNKLATYTKLEHLKMDITAGVWDWDRQGSPQEGASPNYKFPSLRLPALRRLELVVSDNTIRFPRAGPLDLVDCSLLTALSLDIRSCYGWADCTELRLFEGLASTSFPVLSHLEIKDSISINEQRLEWAPRRSGGFESNGRSFPGLVERFLTSLGNLSRLWVDESVLLPPENASPAWDALQTFCSVRELWDSNSTSFHTAKKGSWRAALQTTLSKLESLRVGFGLIDDTEAGLILGCCDPSKLRQFGFTWAWKEYGRDDPISPELLAHLAKFSKLTDVHILFPRPETQVSGFPDPEIDPRTLGDVAAIFKCNGNICRVGFGNSVVFERGIGAGPLLVSDGSSAPNPGVPKFYHAGHLANQDAEDGGDDNTIPRRPRRAKEIAQLRDLLQRILE
ncbi:hypothetical protein C8F04DRAFT_1090650 [Mycena alexandri]|uniref:Uncharacterized protein n=1 Tax=Mycena alexandri TaxID=1745969 RepID=A0AAD6X743_9AGAR|nr:hypothetical protein C8F04DRAFT_1090650 [Mycena alexandri]